MTSLMLLSYGDLLWQAGESEQAFGVYQWAVGHFGWPAVSDIWLVYLTRFQEGPQQGVTLERGRSLFEKVLRECPQKLAAKFYFMYSEYEEQHGLYSQAVRILDRLIENSMPADKLNHFYLYVAVVARLLGVTKTRPIFERALGQLPEKEVLQLAEFYAGLETRLGEIERARKVYEYAAQFSDPAHDLQGMWRAWQEFELQHGDRDSYRELMRVRRAIQQKYLLTGPNPEDIRERVKRGLA